MNNGAEAITADVYIGDDGVLKEGWMDNLSEELRGDETLKNTKDIQGLSSQLVNAQKQLGTAVQMPKDDATPEQKAEFHQRLGCPKTVGEYELKAPTDLPEGMEYREDLMNAMTTIAFGEGASKALMQKLADGFNQWQIENFKTQATKKQTDIEKTFNEGEAALKVEWGADYDKNIEITNKLTTQIPGLMEITKLVFDLSGKGNHPIVHKALYKAALKILPDSVVAGGPVGKEVAGSLSYPSMD